MGNNLSQKIKLINSQTLIPLPENEKDKTKNEKEKTKNEKDKSKNEKDKTKNERNSKDAEHKNIGSKSSSSSSSSNTTSEDEAPELTRKRTTGGRGNKEGGMEIRELYEFLKEKGNLEFIIKHR